MSIHAARPAPAEQPQRARSVVAWNGSRAARAALAWASARERRRGGLVHLVRVIEDTGSAFRLRGDVQRALAELDAEVAALGKAFPGLAVDAELRGGSTEEQLRSLVDPATLLVVGTRPVSTGDSRSPWSLSVRLAGAGRTAVAVVPTETWSWRSGVVVALDGPGSGPAALLGAEEADARSTRLTLVEPEGSGGAQAVADLVRGAFPELDVEVLRVRALVPVLIGLARCAELVVVGMEDAGGRPSPTASLRATLVAASEAPVVVAGAPQAHRGSSAAAGAMRSFRS
jgi:nucleotide-binding universal stress UspA family protein